MDLQDLRTLLDYHYWARDRVLDAAGALAPDQFVRETGSSFKSVRDTLAHLVSAEWGWLMRWQGRSPSSPLRADTFPDLAAIRAKWAELERDVRGFVESLDEQSVGRVFKYQGFSGQPGASAFWQMVQHLVNHGSYHRGQVTTMLRQLGAPPAKSMDLVQFYRERTPGR